MITAIKSSGLVKKISFLMVRVALTSVERDCGGYCGVVGAYSALQYVYGIGIITRSDVRSVSCFADHFDLKNICYLFLAELFGIHLLFCCLECPGPDRRNES